LEKINISDVADGDLRPLLALQNLKEACFDKTLQETADESLKQTAFKIIYS